MSLRCPNLHTQGLLILNERVTVSHLQELLAQLRQMNAPLAEEIQHEIDGLNNRRAFGLNFERHTPEAIELPGRPVRVGDKVHRLQLRGASPSKLATQLYRVLEINRVNGRRMATVLEIKSDVQGDVKEVVAVEDLVVVAEFRDSIYPGLVSEERISRGADKPYNVVITSENFHALQALLYCNSGTVDAIYIDPPYNSGAKDWKYNNDYVEADDIYRHSKWLAMLERRLKLAKVLLNPQDSVLIVSIDEKEYLRLGLLLEQIFPEARMQMVSTIIKPEGTNRVGEFSRTNEFIFFLMFGEAKVIATSDDMSGRSALSEDAPIEWRNLRRRENTSVRGARPNQFYAIFIDEATQKIHSIGDPLDDDIDRHSVVPPPGCIACFPLKPDPDETEMLWGLTPSSLRSLVQDGFARVTSTGRGASGYTVQYLASGTVEAIRNGAAIITGRDSRGAVEGRFVSNTVMPKTTWAKDSHNAQTSGTLIVGALLPGRRFPFPKSLFAVEDALRFFLKSKPEAVVLDFFAGSGTTAHAIFRLNKQDSGRRRAILVTNNEVSEEEQSVLRGSGLRPGDPEWELLGICDHITKPRIKAAITGMTPEGIPVTGRYRYVDEFAISDGFPENVEFFTLTYEAPLRVQSNREFGKIAPFLWLKAGARGRRIESLVSGWDVSETYGVIANLDLLGDFLEALVNQPDVKIAFIVTDDDRLFEATSRELPLGVEPVRLYESYLRNFEIDAMRSIR